MLVSKNILKRYLAGECTSEEEVQITRQLAEDSELVEQLNELLDESWIESGEQNLEDIAALRVKESLRDQLYPAHKQSRKRYSLLWRSAAAVILVVLVSTWMFRSNSPSGTGVAITSTEPVLERIENRLPVNHTYTLPDSSLATLTPGSSLQYEKGFATGRSMTLNGEGFFDVQKDTAHPFTVRSGEIAVTALGTSFRVSDLAQPGRILVQLYTGKVRLTQTVIAKNYKPIILTPGQQWTVDPVQNRGTLATIRSYKSSSRAADSLATSLSQHGPADDGSWSFESRPLSEVMMILQTRYHMPIRYKADQLAGKYFTGTLSPNDSLPLILSSIAALNGLQLNIIDSVAILEKNP